MDTKAVASLMAWLEQQMNQCVVLMDKHHTGDKYLDPSLSWQVREFKMFCIEELDDLRNEFPDIEPDHAAVQPEVRTGNIPDRSDEIDPTSNDPLHVDFAIALVRWSYRKWHKYAGPETRLQILKETISDRESQIESWKNENQYSHTRVTLDRIISESYHLQKTHDFIHRIARDAVGGDVFGSYQPTISTSIAHLANHNLDKGSNAETLSVFSGMRNIVDGAQQWIDSLTGHGFVYEVALQNIDPREYWSMFWYDVEHDPAHATYERIYIGVLHLTRRFTSPSVVVYIRAILDVLIFDHNDSLSEEQALVVGRLIQLIALVDLDDEGRVKLERDIVNALPRMIEPCKASKLVYLEYVAAYKRHVDPQSPPKPVARHLQLEQDSWSCYPLVHHLMPILIDDERMVVLIAKVSEKHSICPLDTLSLVFEPGRTENSVQINAKGFWIDGKIRGTTSETFEDFKKGVEAYIPDIRVELQKA